jgi:hypothetical protein
MLAEWARPRPWLERLKLDVNNFKVFALVLATVGAAGTSAQAASDRSARCGGFPLHYGTSFASTGPSRSKQTASSVMAVAAITPGAESSDLHARAWMVWDERGMSWLAIKKDSPDNLKRLWAFPTAPDFHVRGQVQFTPLKALPRSYTLTDCPDALP